MNFFEKLYLDKKIAFQFYVIMLFCLKIIYWLVVGLFVYSLWEQRAVYMNLFDPKTLNNSHELKSYDVFKDFFMIWLKETGIFILKLLVISLIIKIFKWISIPSIWIKKWEQDNLIDPIFGRWLCIHLRYHKRLSFLDFYNLDKYSKKEYKNFKSLSENENLIEVFKKFDPYFENDKK